MKRTSITIILLLGLVIVLAYKPWSPLVWQSEESIEASFLKKTPYDTSPSAVMGFLKANYPEHSSNVMRLKRTSPYQNLPDKSEYIRSIGATIFTFGGIGFTNTEVQVKWIFDQKEKLIGIQVFKTATGL